MCTHFPQRLLIYSIFQGFVIQHTVTEALKGRILNLIPELLAHALVILGLLQPAWAVAILLGQPLLDTLHNLLIRIQ